MREACALPFTLWLECVSLLASFCMSLMNVMVLGDEYQRTRCGRGCRQTIRIPRCRVFSLALEILLTRASFSMRLRRRSIWMITPPKSVSDSLSASCYWFFFLVPLFDFCRCLLIEKLLLLSWRLGFRYRDCRLWESTCSSVWWLHVF